jgi:iron complex outermembrane receptor protein
MREMIKKLKKNRISDLSGACPSKGGNMKALLFGSVTILIFLETGTAVAQSSQPRSEIAPTAQSPQPNTLGETSVPMTQPHTVGGSPPSATPTDNTDRDSLEIIVVTGSRIANSGFQEPTPVTVIGAGEIQAKGIANINDLLSQVPTFRETSGTAQSERLALQGGGEANLDLRGLGPNRTLVLIDGERPVASNTTATFDVNLIPTLLINRIDVVTGGASAAYGSDAVAGVVNFVLRDHMQGMELDTHYGEAEQGGNVEKAVSFAAGNDFFDGKLHALIGIDYSDNDGVGPIYTRAWGREMPGVFGTGSNRPAGVPAQMFATRAELSNLTPGGLINSGPLAGTAFGPGGVPYAFPYGQKFGTWMTGTNANYDTNTFGHWPLGTPLKRFTSLAKINYDVNENLTLFVTASYGSSQINSFGSFNQYPSLVIDSNNPYIPAATQASLTALHLTSFTLGRNGQDMTNGFNVGNSDDSHQYTVGARGKVFGDWRWDIHYSDGETTEAERSNNMVISPNFYAAVYAVPGPNGTPVCGPVAAAPNLSAAQRSLVQPGCVPINLFGFGSPSKDAINYITGDLVNKYYVKQRDAAFNVQGSPFSTWAGVVSVAAGYDWRHESISSDIGALSLQNAWYAGNDQPLNAGRTVNEVYGETVIPLLHNVLLAKNFEFNGAVRYTDYQYSGGVTTWKLGVTDDIDDVFRLRATRSHDIRAPTLTDLFAGGVPTKAGLINPINGQSGTPTINTHGNPNLAPEVSDTTTAGIIIKPQGILHGLQLSIDYYNITIHDVITTLTGQQILQGCANGIAAYCADLTADSSPFGYSTVTTQPFNAAVQHTNGFDFEVDYRLPIEGLGLPGTMKLRGLTTWVRKLQTTAPNGTFDYAGAAQNGVPNWSYNLNLAYELSQWTGTATVHGTSAIKYDATLIGPQDPGYNPTLPNSINNNRFPAMAYLDLGLQYRVLQAENMQMEVFGYVTNVVNSDPPQYAAIAINSGGDPYNLIGRSYRLGVRFKY